MAAAPWSVRRRPGRRLLLAAAALALALAAGSAWLVPALMLEPEPWYGVLAGILLAGALLVSLLQGSAVRVGEDGILVYALRGTDCIRVDLRRVAAVRPVSAGLLAGAGLDCPVEALAFLGRKGPSRGHCERLRRDLGVALVLEFLSPADAAALEALRRGFALAAAEAADSVRP